MRVMVTGGGTGGHIYPALALIRHMQKTTDDLDVCFVGTDNGMEATIVPREGIPFQSVKITGFRRKLSFENIKTVIRFMKAVRTARGYIRTFQPDIVIGTGGYVCGPVVYAASKAGIPTVIHEQNSVPGLTNKFLSRYADRIVTSFEVEPGAFPKHKMHLLGNPRATEVVSSVEEDGESYLKQAGLDPEKRTILAVGGSRGAMPVNNAVIKLIPKLTGSAYQLIYVTGEAHYEQANQALRDAGLNDQVHVVPYLHNMPAVLKEVDLLIARAGATTLAEITALGLPSIMIPSPYVTNNHQEKNARLIERAGAGIVLLETELSADQLFNEVDLLLSDDGKLERMKENAMKLGLPDAAPDMVKMIDELILNDQKGTPEK
ncbi:undecaprenyldiphospho-muramoylpentapeptide beta-N-acetylglucosaminyltransferase [Salisediminibacterium beveridgei]|uniref:UDP-N-acetylglucosamine--N-acetylmuramyl-(pentapeptide) pyrophosphoryl-undecaprenol N-acetylglucosamine transferase n=1 Tax=Salisediminibacterium beveridgei TaxID=632773 RepID=A0A1D7QW79_9BACI|nr:undecaprenyldiphospho-muramoylpentapeptide beta-N-acetylglucosaminyltransferase [Salisediminibacterium beveridgei]AOM83274.1 UDP-N-acetylglucosamine--N-acetylmuramyl-(pentapeptide) pyrophosphoryl-undecaprenol N-acetylglucosamine transferase [Salisediminibacterium beveridgei]